MNVKCSMSKQIFFRESNPDVGEIVYVKGNDNAIQALNASLSPRLAVSKRLIVILKDIILPQGYPESVSEDYKTYQLWDTLQAFCSTITNTLSTRAVLQGVGVGDEAASSVSAAITWIFKDGVGMVSRILFAWITGTQLDGDCKKWRFFADVMNDLAICTEIFVLPLFKSYAVEILCFSTSVKGIVGVAGGATRAAITQHQAINNNAADVSAKDGSQETCVNLVASIIAIIFLKYFGDSNVIVWNIFFILTVVHLFANYKAVKVLNINKFNQERFNYVIKEYLSKGSVPSPAEANQCEHVILGSSLSSKQICGYNIKLGCSIKKLATLNELYRSQMYSLSSVYRRRKYFIYVSSTCKEIYVLLDKGISSSDLLKAYYLAVIHGILASHFENKNNKVRVVGEKSPAFIIKLSGDIFGDICLNGIDCYEGTMTSYVEGAMKNMVEHDFLSLLIEKGWNVEENYLPVGDWRASWKDHDDKIE